MEMKLMKNKMKNKNWKTMKNQRKWKTNREKKKNKEKQKQKSKSWSGDRTWLSRTSLFKDLHLRSFGHDNSHTLIVLIVGIENVHAL